MLEKLFALAFPPGIRHTGTAYQSKGRWYDGNGVRFYQGTVQPIGGWVQRSLTGAAIVGTPNAAHAWQTNDGSSYLAIGTTTNLYLVTSGNVVYDITPVEVTTDGLTHRWQLTNFGTYLIASFNESNGQTPAINYYAWIGTLGSPAGHCCAAYLGPSNIYGTFVTAERFLMALRGADPTDSDAFTGTFAPIANRVD